MSIKAPARGDGGGPGGRPPPRPWANKLAPAQRIRTNTGHGFTVVVYRTAEVWRESPSTFSLTAASRRSRVADRHWRFLHTGVKPGPEAYRGCRAPRPGSAGVRARIAERSHGMRPRRLNAAAPERPGAPGTSGFLALEKAGSRGLDCRREKRKLVRSARRAELCEPGERPVIRELTSCPDWTCR